jgi:hypothetical protein
MEQWSPNTQEDKGDTHLHKLAKDTLEFIDIVVHLDNVLLNVLLQTFM